MASFLIINLYVRIKVNRAKNKMWHTSEQWCRSKSTQFMNKKILYNNLPHFHSFIVNQDYVISSPTLLLYLWNFYSQVFIQCIKWNVINYVSG
jgi:hypothetical protein